MGGAHIRRKKGQKVSVSEEGMVLLYRKRSSGLSFRGGGSR